MAFQQKATVLGSDVFYRIAPQAKRYTLRDNGFTETNGGNFQLIRPLEATPQSKEGFKLKITVAAGSSNPYFDQSTLLWITSTLRPS